jgi:myo-inositol-1(or 4)-monophosphatase
MEIAMVKERLLVAIEAVKTAGAILMADFGRRLHYEEKNGNKTAVVTEMDLACEKAIRNLIADHFPKDSLLGEEFGYQSKSTDFTWVIDPLCGSLSYSRGLTTFSSAIGILQGGICAASAIFCPATDELFVALVENGSTCNGRPIRVSDTQITSDAVVSIGHRIFRIKEHPRVTEDFLRDIRRLRVGESSNLELCLLAAGRLDAVIIGAQPTYDYCMGMLIVSEAGGRVTDFRGDAIVAQMNTSRNTDILATNGILHEIIRQYF